MQSVDIVILNYNNSKDTVECLDGLRKLSCPGVDLKMIVVDNASTDDSVTAIKQALPDNAELIEHHKNEGYAAGNNIGIRKAMAEKADYICVLNNDTIVEEDFISPCIELLEKDSGIGIVSPIIMEADQDLVQSTGGDIYLPKGIVTVKNHHKQRTELPLLTDCDYVGGACMVFRPSLIEQIGLIPENYFLFFEETEWCYKTKQAGYRNVCLNASYIRHKGSATINTIGGLHAYLMERNRIVFMRRNLGSRAEYIKGVIYLFARCLWMSIRQDISYIRYFAYMKDGLFNKVNHKKYPFITIEENV